MKKKYIKTEEDGDTIEQYFFDEKKHRDNEPAEIITLSNGLKKETYYTHGQINRDDDLPAHIISEKNKIKIEIYIKNNMRHRDNGPAYIEYNLDGSIKETSYWKYGEPVLPPNRPSPSNKQSSVQNNEVK